MNRHSSCGVACPLLSRSDRGEGWEIEKGVRKGRGCFKTGQRCDHALAAPPRPGPDLPKISFYICLNSGLVASALNGIIQGRDRY